MPEALVVVRKVSLEIFVCFVCCFKGGFLV